MFPRQNYLHFSLCKTKFLEKHSFGDILSVNLPDGLHISTLSVATHRRVCSEYLNFGYTDSDTVIVLTRDRRNKHHYLDLYDLRGDSRLKGRTWRPSLFTVLPVSLEIDLSARLGEVTIDKCFSTLGGIIFSTVEGPSY